MEVAQIVLHKIKAFVDVRPLKFPTRGEFHIFIISRMKDFVAKLKSTIYRRHSGRISYVYICYWFRVASSHFTLVYTSQSSFSTSLIIIFLSSSFLYTVPPAEMPQPEGIRNDNLPSSLTPFLTASRPSQPLVPPFTSPYPSYGLMGMFLYN